MKFSKYLDHEWVITWGCTEPAAIAYAVALAAGQAGGAVDAIELTVDPRMYKNCYAVGIPHSGHKTGIFMAASLGAFLKVGDDPLAIFKQTTKKEISAACGLLKAGGVSVQVDNSREQLYIGAVVRGKNGTGKVIISDSHTHISRIEKDGKKVFCDEAASDGDTRSVRRDLAGLSLEQLVDMAASITDGDRCRLQEGIAVNLKIARHGLGLFPEKFVKLGRRDRLTEISQLVCAGVYARMWGEDYPVMSLAGSGNKGIVAAVPIHMWGQEKEIDQSKIDEALALACLITSVSTYHLGSLSAVCGCSNAAGIGLACGLVRLGGGSVAELSYAITNMVGNVTGMICDGAKIGCALKTMTAVDSAFRAATLALSGIGIPFEDGIVAKDGIGSLKNMARIANCGMIYTDQEILKIMGEKSDELVQKQKS